MGPETQGAYGFRLVLRGSQARLPDLAPVADDAETVTVEHRHAALLVDRDEREAQRIAVGRRGSSLLEVRGEPPQITVELPDSTSPEALVHPLLTVPLSILARWRGDITLHAGSFFSQGLAWAVVGSREAGKSTTLAELARRGLPLLADDLLVLDKGVARAGPACIDLRPDVAERIAGARPLGEVAGRPRYRLSTPLGPPRAKLGGFFLLDWSETDAIEIEALPPTEILQVIYRQEYIALLGPADPAKILDLVGIPMWRVRRPRDWDRTDEVLDAILALTAENGA